MLTTTDLKILNKRFTSFVVELLRQYTRRETRLGFREYFYIPMRFWNLYERRRAAADVVFSSHLRGFKRNFNIRLRIYGMARGTWCT